MNISSILLAAGASAVLTAGAGVGQSAAESAQSAARPWPASGVCSTFKEERNRQLLQERLELLAAGDFTADLEYFADDAVVEVHGSVPYAGTYPVAGGQYGQMLGSVWEFSGGDTGEDPELLADCDTVTLIGQFTATSRVTGQLLDTRVIELFTFDKDGKIVRDDFYFTDTAEVNRVLGAG